jgi:hypothetical protein
MRRLLVPASAAVLLAAAAPASAAPVCATGAPAAAAVALYGPGTTLASTGRVAGMRTALALQPLVEPGTRRRMLASTDGWCDAATGFGRAWTGGSGRAAAIAFARVAAAPYFDRVRVLTAREAAPGTFVLRTHAFTNGVVARWTIATDAAGVASATWTATDFAQHPLAKQWEGLTAHPGATETYTRGADGVVTEARGLDGLMASARRDALAPGLADYVSSDGMTLSVSLGDTHVAVDPGADAGEFHADIVRWTLRALKVNYEDFQSWGFTKGWNARTDAVLPDRGFVSINDALSLYCTACVLTGEEFNIHFLSEFATVLGALGYTYGDATKAFNDVIGHEMFHNFQNRYNKPGQPGQLTRSATTSYSEGTARFQETLHASYSDVNRTAKTLYYATDTNGCNGYDYDYASMDAAMANGPFAKSYNTCYFWSAWYGAYGADAFTKLVTTTYPANIAQADGAKKGLQAIADATGDTVLGQMRAFAIAALTGRNLSWAPLGGPGEAYDWGQGLERWKPATLAPGATATASLSNGGMMARELKQAATISVTDNAGLNLAVLREDAAGATLTALPRTGTAIAAPAAGERVWVLVVRPVAGAQASATLRAA